MLYESRVICRYICGEYPDQGLISCYTLKTPFWSCHTKSLTPLFFLWKHLTCTSPQTCWLLIIHGPNLLHLIYTLYALFTTTVIPFLHSEMPHDDKGLLHSMHTYIRTRYDHAYHILYTLHAYFETSTAYATKHLEGLLNLIGTRSKTRSRRLHLGYNS